MSSDVSRVGEPKLVRGPAVGSVKWRNSTRFAPRRYPPAQRASTGSGISTRVYRGPISRLSRCNQDRLGMLARR
jgi:hypothetical protein